MMRAAARAAGILLAAAHVAGAQTGWLSGDSLLALGRVGEAESAFYAAVRSNPRDPAARLSLGRFLASRGAVRVGTVLMEEARQFGADSAAIAALLAPWYVRLGDYKALGELRHFQPSEAERLRLSWLQNNPTSVRLRDSTVTLRYRAAPRGPGVGTVLLRVGRTELAAAIDPGVSGVVLPSTVRSAVTVFDGANGTTAAATFTVGAQAFENVPATLTLSGDAALIGLDLLAPYSPTFDPTRGTLELHRPDRRWRPWPGTRVPALYDHAGVRLLLAAGWTPSSDPTVERLLASRAWTWDARRGDVVLLTP